MKRFSLGTRAVVVCLHAQEELGGGLAAQSDFGSVDAEDPGIAPGRAQGARHLGSWQKPKFHKPLRDIGGKIEAVEDAVFALLEFSEGDGGPYGATLLLETQLHYALSMKWVRPRCQYT